MNPALDAEKISYALVDGYWRVKVVDEIDSTQRALAAEELLTSGDVLAAEFQSAGRGRINRKFEAAKSLSLLFSLYYEPRRSREEWGAIALIAGLSVAQSLGDGFSTKWPNDVIHATGKVSGTLCEFHRDGVIVGIGINTAMTSAQLPVPTATSVAIATGVVPDRNLLLADVLTRFAANIEMWESGMGFIDAYSARSATIGSAVKAELPDGSTLEGLATGVSELGELLLSDGKSVSVGDITHLK